jgi:hypothetical protein
MGIKKREACPGSNVMPHHRLQQSGFAGARFPNYIHVIPAISLLDTKHPSVVPEIDAGEVIDGVVGFYGHSSSIAQWLEPARKKMFAISAYLSSF